MVRSGEEIQRQLKKFVSTWSGFSGTEKAEAQTFLNQLFTCYGTDRKSSGAKFEDFKSSAGFMDLHWPAVCIIEMKAPNVQVSSAREQVKRYWEESADDATDTPAAKWVVLCNFKSFEVWEPGRFPKSPRATFDLAELPGRYETLMFLTGPEQLPSFLSHHKQLTTEAASTVGAVYESLVERLAAPVDEIIRFTMQSVWTMFAEDLGLLDGAPFQKTVLSLRGRPDESAATLGFLFRVLNQKGNHNRKGLLAGTRYVNGDLFSQPAEVGLNADELARLSEAAEYDWSKVEPTIFGSLMEKVIAGKLGAHYTHESDIMKIVAPTVIRPWQRRIDQAHTPAEAAAVLDALCAFRVLDPACGCGNFLYVAYREMRQLEFILKQRIIDLASSTGLPVPADPRPYVPLTNFYGLDIQPAAVLIARVTLWMGHRQMIDRYGEAENPLPLVSLAGITQGDALRVAWPATDCIVGNPPFLGSQLIRRELGDTYADWLKTAFGVGVKELCVYWFRLAHQHLQPGQRAGLVGTNSIAQNKGRVASLGYITEAGGTITDAVVSQKWPGEANVHVSIVNWVKGPETGPYSLDGAEVPAGIDQSLRPAGNWIAKTIASHKNKSFQGVVPVGSGFILTDAVAEKMLKDDPANAYVVRRYLDGDDLTEDPQQQPNRWIVDFGTMELEEARRYKLPYRHVELHVRPGRVGAKRHFEQIWWQFGWPRPVMRKALAPLERYIAVGAQGKRLIATWQNASTTPSNLIVVIALQDDFSMGVINSATHRAWAWMQSSTLETRLRYTPSSVFMTFPWPHQATEAQRDAIAAASTDLLSIRNEVCVAENVGLTAVYNVMEDGGHRALAAAHTRLDRAVADSYGWPSTVAQDTDEIGARLLILNRQVTERSVNYLRS